MSRGEFQLISEFVSAFKTGGGAVRIGPGDDCAVLNAERDELCVTTDAVVEGVHFSRPYFSFEDIGHKALAVNLSDLAAMGSKPSWFVCAIATAAAPSRSELRVLARGMSKLAAKHGCVLAGGNFTRASELSVTITAAGTVPPGTALLRSGAKKGDVLFVSGTLGEAAAALASKAKGENRQKRPQPRVALGLIARTFAHAAIDVSDGFIQDLGHLCRASGVRAEVHVPSLPARAGALQHALTGGEDYELLLAVPPHRAAAFERACTRAGEKVIRVGHFVRGSGISLLDAPSRLLQGRAGHDHFVDLPVRGD